MASDLRRLAPAVLLRSSYVRALFEQLANESVQHEIYAEVAGYARSLSIVVDSEIERVLEIGAGTSSEDSRDYLTYVQRLGILLEQVHRLSEFLEPSNVLALPGPMSLYTQDLVQPFLVNHSRPAFLFRAQAEFNYHFDPLAREIAMAVEASGLSLRDRLNLGLFRFPAGARDDALLHAILAHEVGHLLDQELEISKRLFVRDQLYMDSKNKLAERLDLVDVTAGINKAAMADAILALQRWIGEVVCDLIAVHLLGPAFALAVVEFLGLSKEDSVGSSTHPPPSFRLWYIQSELNHLGWHDFVQSAAWDRLEGFTPQLPTDPATFDQQRSSVMSGVIGAYLERCQRSVREFMSGRSVEANRYAFEAENIEAMLKMKVPPGEVIIRGKPHAVPPALIVIGCWMFWSKECPEWSRHDDQARMMLGRLMLKALEASRIRRVLVPT